MSGHATTPDDDLLTLPEAARALAVSERTVRRWIKAGTLPAGRLPTRHGHFRIRRTDVAAALDRA